jgi:hypothetical protein
MGAMLMPMLLAFVGVFALTSMGGCDKDKDKDKQKAMINACLNDETGECQRKAAKFAEQNPRAADAAARHWMQNNPNGNHLSNDPANTAMLQQAMKVQQGFEDDRNNPDSAFYEGPSTATESNLAGAKTEEVPVAILPASTEGESATAPASVGVLGQTTQ